MMTAANRYVMANERSPTFTCNRKRILTLGLYSAFRAWRVIVFESTVQVDGRNNVLQCRYNTFDSSYVLLLKSERHGRSGDGGRWSRWACGSGRLTTAAGLCLGLRRLRVPIGLIMIFVGRPWKHNVYHIEDNNLCQMMAKDLVAEV